MNTLLIQSIHTNYMDGAELHMLHGHACISSRLRERVAWGDFRKHTEVTKERTKPRS